MDSEELRRETEEIVRLHGELVRRLTRHGFRDVADLVERYEHLCRVASAMTREEIEAGLIRLGTLLDHLRLMRVQIEQLSRMHQQLVVLPERLERHAAD